ncbi:low molecular weight phosphatase family protein [Promicromonospora sp. MS192]|uniref:arsenate reductase/protein-tyrosine-phosphatase family protein n=1 Tax=Promicromonospora sp. MS192 TaxID=3412684 RepID=UPI003C2BB32E
MLGLTMSTSVLAVCTGNICRSPVLARLLTARTDGTVRISSAGVRARRGEPIDPRMASLLQARGLDTGQFTAHQLTGDALRSATVVITMTRAQRAAVVRAVPEAVRRTFTLLELAHVLSTSPGARSATDDAARWAQVPELVSLERLHHPALARELDIEDPYGRSEKVYRRAFERIVSATDTVCGVLGTGRQPWLLGSKPPRSGPLPVVQPQPRHSSSLGRL